MRLTVLGSGTIFPVPHRGPTGAWLQTARASVLVDCGSGVVQKLVKAGGVLAELDAVLLTHAHLDHIGDLPTLLFALRQLGARQRPLRIIHSAPLSRYLAGLRQTFGPWLEPQSFSVSYQDVAAFDHLDIGDLHVKVFAVDHHETSVGYRFEGRGGEVLAVPSDTAHHASVVEGVRGADLVLLECSATDEAPRPGHLTPKTVLEILWEAAPRAALLTHLTPEAEAAGVVAQIKPLAPCPVWEARDGLAVQVTRGGMSFAAEAAPAAAEATRSPAKTAAAPARPPAAPARAAKAKRPQDLPPDPEFTQLLEESLAAVDPAELARRKSSAPAARTAPGSTAPGAALPRHLSEQALRGLTPSRAQKTLLELASRAGTLPEVNLRGLVRDDALTQLRAALQTWLTGRHRLARIITGKGKHSQQEPIIKLAVLEWIETEEGVRWIEGWAPEQSRDGSFGSLVVALRL